ncbi:MAG TPA: hypothetical protein VGM90_00090 [Kofleriaceae bacterium]|jgi:hypothetical protein
MRALSQILLATTLCTAGVAAADDQCQGKADAAKCYIDAGRELVETKPGEAATFFLASYRLDPKIDPLASYGLALAADQQFADAAEVLEKAVEEYDKLSAQFQQDNKDAQTTFAVLHRIQAVKEELKKLGSNIGWVQLKTETPQQLPAGYVVKRKNGNDLHSSDPTRLVMKAKGDALVVTYPNGHTAEFPVNVAGGSLNTMDIPAEPPPEAPKPVEKPVEMPVNESAKLRTHSYFAFAGGGVLFAGGIVYTLASSDPVYPISGALIVLGLGGLGLGGYWYYKADQMDSQPKTALIPTVSNEGFGAAFVGRF